jgi:RimJ/RimL family protein N-acetyltransferase
LSSQYADPAQRPLPMIRGERVYLRPAERDDIPTFVRWFNDAETSSFLGMRAPMSVPMEEEWFSRTVAQQGKEGYHFVICRLDDDRPIGTIGLFALDLVNGSAGMGITIGEKQLWSQGYGSDALNALVDFGFGALRLERIWLDVFEHNARGRRSYEKCGFVLEGTRRRAEYRDGRHLDVHQMSLLRDEWAGLERRRSWDYRADAGAGRPGREPAS